MTHYGGVVFFHEFIQVLQWRRFASWNLDYPRPHQRYSLPQILLALVYPLILGLDRLETAALLQANGTFQYLTGLPSYPDAQTLRRFLLQAPRPNFASNCIASTTGCCGGSFTNPNTARA